MWLANSRIPRGSLVNYLSLAYEGHYATSDSAHWQTRMLITAFWTPEGTYK